MKICVREGQLLLPPVTQVEISHSVEYCNYVILEFYHFTHSCAICTNCGDVEEPAKKLGCGIGASFDNTVAISVIVPNT